MEQVFDQLRKANLQLKPSFICIEVKYLEHIISVEGVRPDPGKTEKVRSFPVPQDVTQIRQFLGLASYYRCFVPKFLRLPLLCMLC